MIWPTVVPLIRFGLAPVSFGPRLVECLASILRRLVVVEWRLPSPLCGVAIVVDAEAEGGDRIAVEAGDFQVEDGSGRDRAAAGVECTIVFVGLHPAMWMVEVLATERTTILVEERPRPHVPRIIKLFVDGVWRPRLSSPTRT